MLSLNCLILLATIGVAMADLRGRHMNDQVNNEYRAAYAYDYLANRFSRSDVALFGFAKFFRKEAAEERSHAEQLADFMTKKDIPVIFMPVNLDEFKELESVTTGFDGLASALKLEKANSQAILKLSQLFETGEAVNGVTEDHNIVNFLDNYIHEQVESEYNLKSMMQRLKNNKDSTLEFLMDQELMSK